MNMGHRNKLPLAWFRWGVTTRLDRIDQTLQTLMTKDEFMSALDDLKAQLDGVDAKVAEQTTVNASAVALLQQLKTMVDGITQAPDLSSAIAQAQAISDHIAANDQAMADAVSANTPASPPAPAPEPAPADPVPAPDAPSP